MPATVRPRARRRPIGPAWAKLAALVLVALGTLCLPRRARAADDDAGRARASSRPTKRRARVESLGGRDRVGTGDHVVHETRSAVSVGSPSEGRLENGVHLDTSKNIHVVSAYQRGDVRWGHPALTHLLERGARAVAKRWPGAVLDVGDLSRKNGGDVLRHHSHESGRDADVAFYVDDAKGKPLHAPFFVRFDANLRSTNTAGAHLDEARTWAFLQAILTDPGAHVSHVFVAEPIRQRLLAYARGHGVSHALWMRAATTMMQPTDAEPHDDHMHVRISCPSSSRGSCLEVAARAIHHRTVASRPVTKRPAVFRTPPRAVVAVGLAGRPRDIPPPLDRGDAARDDLAPLARARALP